MLKGIYILIYRICIKELYLTLDVRVIL